MSNNNGYSDSLNLPRDEFSAVVSAINNAYGARFSNKEESEIVVGSYLYHFEIIDFNEYRFTAKEEI